MPSPSSSSSTYFFLRAGFAPSAFLLPVLPFRPLALGLRGRSSTASTTSNVSPSTRPGVVNVLPHRGHLPRFPSGTGLIGFKTDLQSGHVIRGDAVAMVRCPEELTRTETAAFSR